MKPNIYPHPRPTSKQIAAAIAIAEKRRIPLPEIDYLTAGKLGEWIRLNTEGGITSIITITVYKNGTSTTKVDNF